MTRARCRLARLAVEVLPAPKEGGPLVLPSLLARLLALSATGSLPHSVPFEDLAEALTARAELGRARYGQDLRAGDGRGVADLAQEILDAMMYTERLALGGLLGSVDAGLVIAHLLRALALTLGAQRGKS